MELPGTWQSVRLGDVVDIGSQQVDPASQPSQTFFYVQMEDVAPGQGRLLDIHQVLGDKIGSSKTTFNAGDVVYGRLRPYLRKVFVADRDGIAVTDLIPLRSRGGIEPGFLRDYLLSPFHSKYIGPLMAGIRMPRLRTSDLEVMPLPLPPLNEQRRIVARLEELTARTKAARGALEAIPPLLDRFRQSVLAAAFRGDLTADWRAQNPDVEPASELLKRIRVERRRRWEEAEIEKMRAKGKVPGDDRWKARYVEPEGVDAEGLPELPEGWVWTTVEQAAFVNLGRQRSPRNHNGPHMRPYLRAANVTWTGIDISDVREMNFDPTEVTGYLLEPGDILLSEGSGSAREVGKPAVFRGEVTGCCFQNTLVRVRCPVLALVEWLHLHFLCDALSGRFASLSRGIGIHHIGREGIAQWPVAIPPLEEQRRILASVGQALESTEVTVTKVSAISTALDHLHQSLLSKAFRGELVPQDPTDEPASVLLERIRKEREAAGGGGRPKRGRKAKQESSRAGVPILAEESPVRLAESEV